MNGVVMKGKNSVHCCSTIVRVIVRVIPARPCGIVRRRRQDLLAPPYTPLYDALCRI
jgi:hypothetical protein